MLSAGNLAYNHIQGDPRGPGVLSAAGAGLRATGPQRPGHLALHGGREPGQDAGDQLAAPVGRLVDDLPAGGGDQYQHDAAVGAGPYAFSVFGAIAFWASIASFCLAFIMAVLGGFGFWHARRTPAEAELLGPGSGQPAPAP